MSLTVLIPVLGRPHRVEPLLLSLTLSAPGHSELFICDPSDTEEIAAVRDMGAQWIEVEGTYAEKVNAAVRSTDAELLFLGADDLEFQPGWLEAAQNLMVDGIGVVGVNDLIRRRKQRIGHATHFLMARWYAEQPAIDGSDGPLHTGYSHWCIDDELIGTATKRGAYAYAADSHVKHLHPFAGLAEDDKTYRKGRARMNSDLQLCARRQPLWTT